MNEYLKDYATVESSSYTFEDGVELMEEQFALESMFKDLDTFTGVLNIMKPDMDSSTAEALSLALDAPVSAVQTLATVEEDGILKKAIAAIKKTYAAFTAWISKNWKKFLAMFKKSADTSMVHLTTMEKDVELDKDTEKNISEFYKDDSEAKEKALKDYKLGKVGGAICMTSDYYSAIITGFSETTVTVYPKVEHSADSFSKKEPTIKEVLANFPKLLSEMNKSTKDIEDAIKEGEKLIDKAESDADIKAAKDKLAMVKAKQGQPKVYVKALADYVKALKIAKKTMPKAKE